MKDSREMYIKYFELKLKLLGDLKTSSNAYASLSKKSNDPKNNEDDSKYFQIWANIILAQQETYKNSLEMLDKQINDLNLSEQVNDLLRQREDREQKRKIIDKINDLDE